LLAAKGGIRVTAVVPREQKMAAFGRVERISKSAYERFLVAPSTLRFDTGPLRGGPAGGAASFFLREHRLAVASARRNWMCISKLIGVQRPAAFHFGFPFPGQPVVACMGEVSWATASEMGEESPAP
jgi:hypothetical protein